MDNEPGGWKPSSRKPRESIEELLGDVVRRDAPGLLYGDGDAEALEPPAPTARRTPPTPPAARGRGGDAPQPPEQDAASPDQAEDDGRGEGGGPPDGPGGGGDGGEPPEEPPAFARKPRWIDPDQVHPLQFDMASKAPRNTVLGLGALSVLTLGLYRFWMKTEVRRVFWSHTRLGKEPFEYTGTGLELFVGGMFAIVVLAVYLAAFNLGLSYAGLAYWQDETGIIAVTLSLIAVLPLLYYAQFRARRYRLLRTRWRGIRFSMDGSAWRFAAMCLAWQPVLLATATLAYPYYRLARERYMTRRMAYGDAAFEFEASAGRLLPPYLTAAVLVAAPVAAVGYLTQRPDHAQRLQAEVIGLGASAPAVIAAAVLGYALLVFLAWMRYRARELNVIMEGRRICDVRVTCRLSTASLVGPYAWVLWRSIWPGLVIMAIIVAISAGPIALAFITDAGFDDPERLQKLEEATRNGAAASLFQLLEIFNTVRGQVLFAMGVFLYYASLTLFAMWMSVAVYFRQFHNNLCRATAMTGVDSLNSVRQREGEAQLEAEGFADALDAGGL